MTCSIRALIRQWFHSLPQDSVGVFRNVFDLHTGHGAILTLIAPNANASPVHGE